jgi:hypothetical protein
MKPFPNTVDDMIRELNVLFPESIPGPDDTVASMMHNAGQRSVIQFLNQWRAHPEQRPEPPRRGAGRPTR